MKLYCGTYRKYNNGSLAGAWLNLDAFKDGAEFEAACRRLHKDERDPELMFQDVETDPGEDWQEGLYSESSIPWDYWKLKAEAAAEKAKARANEPKGAKAEREEQARMADEYTTLREGYTQTEHPKAWERWRKYYGKEYYFIRLFGGEIVAIEKPSIQTRFCCGEDDRGQGGDDPENTPGTIAYAERVLENKRTEAGFKRANVGDFDERMIYVVGRKPWRLARAVSEGRAPYLLNDKRSFVPCLVRGSYAEGDTAYRIDNAIGRANCGTLVRILNDEDFRLMRRAYMTVRTDFKKRLNAYWKRFGASKIHTWTYWTEA